MENNIGGPLRAGGGGLRDRRRVPKLGGIRNQPLPGSNREEEAAKRLNRTTTATINDQTIVIDPLEVEVLQTLGKGAYGVVNLVRHSSDKGSFEFAVKRTGVNQAQERFLMDMDVLVKSVNCPQIVKFYGALFWESELWLFMEVMDASLDKFYQLAHQRVNAIPECVLGKIASSAIKALNHLHANKVIHRDVKPSNILINRQGEVKLCDFGIAGPLINSVAKTVEVGCKPYMSPERINPSTSKQGYDIRSDVWSLGITMLEIATGQFPYQMSGGREVFFILLQKVCNDDPPKLPPGIFSHDFEDFIGQCLQKDFQSRPNYITLLQHPFIISYQDVDISEFARQILDS
ncbi:dual specificity mitogen-activated protein kinase kinase lic isoform X2 [Brevipalpus obovatus]|uniref:dual specificity mitogen-activated protein kinase kinase lic isoform X2 n=1 Tax=Brevipalpus obovatus TaxID=246614 RepID=UPI003D9F665F